MTSYIDRARAVGMEVLLVTPMQSNPYYDSVFIDWVPRSQIAAAIRTLAVQKNVRVAPMSIPNGSTSDARHRAGVATANWFNHPGVSGHAL